MAYLFGISNTNVIDCGTTPPKAGTWSMGLRFRPTQSIDTTYRRLLHFSAPGNLIQAYLLLAQASGHANQVGGGFSTAAGTAFAGVATWDSGFAAGSLHTLVLTYDQSNFNLYADTDTTPKSTNAETRVPDQSGSAHFYIGNETDSLAADSTIYEVFWAPGVIYTGAQAAQFGAGFDARFLNPKPSNHWRLVADARDLIGNAHGTVTGASLVAHNARIYYPAPPLNRGLAAVVPPEATDPATYTVGSKVEILTHAAQAGLSPSAWFWQDSGIGILNNGNGTYTSFASVGGAAHSGQPGRMIGTLANLLSVSATSLSVSGRQDAPDATIAQITYQGGGPIYKDSATGRLIIFTHNERPLNGSFPGTQFYSWLGIITSTDGGTTWTDCGTIITPHHTWAEMDALYAGFGKGDGSNYFADIAWGSYVIVGPYFYVYFRNCDGAITSSGLTGNFSGVARALVADVITAAATATVPVFHKWNGTDWSELGIRGTGTSVADAIAAVSYNTHRHRYISLNPYGVSTGTMTLRYRESVDGITWSNVQKVATDVSADSPFQIYATMVDPASFAPYLTGRTLYFISKSWDVAADSVNRWLVTLDGVDADAQFLVLQHAAGSRGD